MTLTVISSNFTSAAGNGRTLVAGEDIYVSSNVTFGSSFTPGSGGAAAGIFGEFSHDVTVMGHVIGYDSGITLGNDLASDGFMSVFVGAQGSVTSFGISGNGSAIRITAHDCEITNHGVIFGNSEAIRLGGVSDGSSSIINHGTIESHDTAIVADSGRTENIIIHNYGRIVGDFDDNAVSLFGGTGKDTILNRGLIISNVGFDEGADRFDNRGGTVTGDVSFGGGADRYDGRNGEVSGSIDGGIGNDFFLVGAKEDTIDGGTEADTLDFQGGGAFTLALNGTLAGSGLAAGDVYTNIENVFGSISGSDIIHGNALNNLLAGRGGNDTLNGVSGNDTLLGQLGADRLTGSIGDDSFRFDALAECGDLIADFSSSAAGNNDRFQINDTGFGGGLTPTGANPIAGTLFRARADNLAQDGDDRFIFRTTDKTLWFDANGNAAGGLTMIADLQASATVTAADIFVI